MSHQSAARAYTREFGVAMVWYVIVVLASISFIGGVGQPIKNRLRVLRAERDWSQGELADNLDVSRQTVNALENEKYDPSLPLAFRIASLFGKRIEEIFEPE